MQRVDLELWGGPEYTLNRVGDRFVDQFERCGHIGRPDDLELFASLGVKAIRYPISWERLSGGDDGEGGGRSRGGCDWDWHDARLNGLRDHGIRVIAGLVHHGSGPPHTSLLDDEGFATGLAAHADQVARRYPWIGEWTPVNEPVTTARFSGLYGHWYPHHKDERSFWRALLNQVDAIRLSMAAIRAVNSAARLIQTDDLGRTFATAAIREQAGFDNMRRWAGWDLLCGHVTPAHPLWLHIAGFGLEHRLRAIADAPCPPDIIGINHYLTSDRFLDHRLHRYPSHVRGGNGRQRYADIEACRVLEPAPPGLAGALREAWERYAIPVAVTEVHNGCTREEQLRWLADAWDTATSLRGEGVDVRAVTIWSLLGSNDWNTLLTGPGVYEPGAFDVRSAPPRPTALAALAKGLPSSAPRHMLTAAQGWWRRPDRLVHPAVRRPASLRDHWPLAARAPVHALSPLLICGATGTLGRAFARACEARNIPFALTDRRQIDLNDERSIHLALDRHRPWAVVNAAGWVRVDDAETAAVDCLAVNAQGAIRLSRAAADRGIPTVNFSSDLVFDGTKADAYVESDDPAPGNIYGQSKARMEAGVLGLPGAHLIVRTAAFFSPFDIYNFAHAVMQSLSAGQTFAAVADLIVTPTYVPHLVDATLDLLVDAEAGVWHLTNAEALSWAAFARRIASMLLLPDHLIEPVSAARFQYQAHRPPRVALSSERGLILPSLSRGLEEYAYHTERLREDRAAA